MRRRRSTMALGLLISAVLSLETASGSETINYSYDVLGRLQKASRSGAVNNGVNACYRYDQAGNRQNVKTGTSDCSTVTETPPSFTISDSSATESGGLIFTVSKAGTVASSYSVDFSTASGTATAGSDYSPASGTLMFAAAESSKTVTVSTIDDGSYEAAETLYLNLSGATNGAIVSDGQGLGTINDNDAAPPPNQPPVATADSTSVRVCESGSAIVTSNDSDPDGDTITLTAVTSSAYVDAYVASPTTVGVNAFGTPGSTQVTYTISDGRGGTANGVLSISVLNGTGCQ